MNKLRGKVLELFLKDKKENKISNIIYGKKALDKYVEEAFKNDDEKDKKKYLKQWDSSKLSNSVYFVYKSSRGKNKQIKKMGHRFISNASKEGGYSYLGHLESNNKKSFKKKIPVSVRKRKRSVRRKKVQSGGFCLPCLPVAAGAVGGAVGGAASIYSMYKSKSSGSSYKKVGNKVNVKNYTKSSKNMNGIKKKGKVIQDNKFVTINGKRRRYNTLAKATREYKRAISRMKG